jgi:hypothetical protein
MVWLYENKPLLTPPPNSHSFIYLITNLKDNKKYIGKKCFYSFTSAKVEGKIRRKKSIKESNWKNYFGSCVPLKEDVKRLGVDNFKREILHICYNKAQATYYEAHYQFQYGVLLSDDWYNNWIDCTVNKVNLTAGL